jgi:hypothetical protein
MHRDYPPFTVLIHAAPYSIRRRWHMPDGTTKDTEYPPPSKKHPMNKGCFSRP